VSVAKRRVRVLPHMVNKQVEGVALQGGHMMLMCTIVILINRIYEKAVYVVAVSFHPTCILTAAKDL
jgi:hypothetical protein